MGNQNAGDMLDVSTARSMLYRLFDQDTFTEIDRFAMNGELPCEAVAGFGLVDGNPVYAFAQNHDVCFGAIGRSQSAKIAKIYALAAQNGAPVIGIFDSDGARLGEKLDAMDAIASLLSASNNISGVVPQIALIAGSCIGSAAVIAANADITVSAGTVDYYLNPGDDNAVVDISAPDLDSALEQVRKLVALLPSNNLSTAPAYDYDISAGEFVSAAEAVCAIADSDSAVALGCGECKTVLARVGGTVCGLVALIGDGGRVSCCDTARVARFVRMCDGFSVPVISFVDAAGFAGLKCAAKISHAYAEATTTKLTVITGQACGAAYIAAAGLAAGADVVLAWPGTVILPMIPEAAVPVLWKEKWAAVTVPEERDALFSEYTRSEGAAESAAAAGHVTDIVTPAETKTKLIALLDMLAGKRISRLPKKHSNIVL